MDADTRHQLKTNELSELLERLRDFNNPYVKYPLIAAAVLVLGWIGWSSYSFFHRHGQEIAWQQLADVERQLDPNDPNYPAAVNELVGITQRSGDSAIGSAARLHLARLRYDEGLRTPAERLAKFQEAQTLLTEVRRASGTPPLLDAAAAFGLASTLESLAEMGDRSARLAEARKLYEEITTQPRFGGSPFIALATERLNTLDTLNAAISLTPGMAPASPTAAMPTPVIAPGSGNEPQLSVTGAGNVQQLTPEEVQELMGKMNSGNQPPPVQPAPGVAAPPAGQPVPPPAPAEPAPAQPTPPPAETDDKG